MKKLSIVFICAAMLAGCSIAVHPKHVPSSAGAGAPDLTGAIIMVANAEQDSSEYAVRDEKGKSTPVIVNRMKWSRKLVETLASDMAKRGARVRANPKVTLNISIPEITFSQFGELFQFKVTAAVVASTGWSRQYDGIAETTPGVIESSAGMTERLAGDALSKVIRAMLRDEDFVALVKLQPGPDRQVKESTTPLSSQPSLSH
jgi:uncharacterized lipoprotein YajG